MKKILLFIVVLLAVGVCGYAVVMKSNTTTIYSGLTDRGKEYIKEKKKDNAVPWLVIDIDGVTSTGSANLGKNKVFDNGCFTMIIPFEVEKQKKQGECFFYYTTLSPRASLTVYYQDADATNLNEDTSVMMRRSNKGMYSEKSVEMNGRTYVIFEKSENNTYEETAFNITQGKLFVLNLNTYSSESSDSEFQQMLRSLEFK
jgi:hypothetical protein